MSKAVYDCCLQEEIPFELLDIANHPTPSDLERKLGKDLADVFLKTCTPLQKILFGRDKPLKGPGTRMWINPEDRLNGNKVKITEAPSQSTSYTDCIKALTHHGILEIGKKYEEKLAELNSRAVDDAVKETEELSKFEADLKIKFHVEAETKKLNEEWHRRLQELIKIHEVEKNDMKNIIEESRAVLFDSITKKYKEETEKLVEKAKAEVREEMREECAKIIDDELAQQEKVFEKSMETTLNNLSENDRDKMDKLRNQCLKAMDVQHHLMMCRQITELLHLMSVEKSHWEGRLCEMRVKYEATISSLQARLDTYEKRQQHLSREHQSKSTFTTALMTALNGIDDVNALDEHEKRIFDEIQRMCRNGSNGDDDVDSRIFTITEPRSDAQNSHSIIDKNDWINRNEEEKEMIFPAASVTVEWQHQNASQITSNNSNVDAFMSSIFNKMSVTSQDVYLPRCQISIPKIVSSIIAAIKESKNDETLLWQSINNIFQNMSVENQQRQKPAESIINPVVMPSTRSHLGKRDSLEVAHNKRNISIATEATEPRLELLSAIDSLEILQSRRVSSRQLKLEDRNSPPSFQSLATISEPSNETEGTNECNGIPPYMKIPPYRCPKFTKMTEEEWLQLQVIEKLTKLSQEQSESTPRRSSIQFESFEQRSSFQNSKKSSNLKMPTMDIKTTTLVNDALQPIRKKCLEAVDKMKVESVLRILCEQNENP